MAGDRRVALVGQAEFAEAGNRPPRRAVAGLAVREETVDQERGDALPIDLRGDRAADELAAAAEHRNRVLVGLRAFRGQERFLGVAAGMPQGDRLPGVEPGSLLGEAAGDEMGQGQVHVVAAHEEVVSHGHAAEDQLAAFFGHGDQGEVGRAAADVADQERVAELQGPPPAVAAIGEPGVDGGLRLLQEDEIVGQPRRQRRLAGQLAGAGVEGGRHGQHHELFRHRGLGVLDLPGRNHVLQVTLRGRDRRDLGHALRRAPGQDRLVAIDPAVGQPRLGRAHRAVGHGGPLPPGIFAHGEIALLGPGQIEGPAAGLAGIGQVGERRQHGPRLDRAAVTSCGRASNSTCGLSALSGA